MAPNKKNGTANGNENHHQNHNNNNNISNNNNNTSRNGSALKQNKKQSPSKQKQIKVRKPKTRDSGCCSINFIKYVLIIIDIVFFVSRNYLKNFNLMIFSSEIKDKTLQNLRFFEDFWG